MLSTSWSRLVTIVIILGICFRIINLGNKIYWVDEVATSLRVAGFTKQEIVAELSEQHLIDIKSLQKYQQINDDKNFEDTWQALTKSPEHAPLYFTLARIWTQWTGLSVITIRLLSVLLSLLALTCIYWLSQQLFPSTEVKWIAVCFLAVSPLYVAYAQEARPYSLWIVIILLSQIALIQALRSNTLINWILYGISLILSFYTSLLSFLIVIGQVIYVLSISNKKLFTQLFVVSIAVLAFSPWLIIMVNNWQLIQENTTWMNIPLNPGILFIVWLYSISTVFIETPLYPTLDAIIVIRLIVDLNFLILMLVSFYFLYKTTSKAVWLFFASQLLIPVLLLIAIDLCLGGQRSTAIRYLMPSYLLIHIALAYLFVNKILGQKRQRWKAILAVLLLIQISSCLFMSDKSPRYQKTRNLHNPAIAQIINQSTSPILLTEEPQILDAISLSYLIKAGTKFKLLNAQENLDFLIPEHQVFILKPSLSLLNHIRQQKLMTTQIYQPRLLIPEEIYLSLWKIEIKPS